MSEDLPVHITIEPLEAACLKNVIQQRCEIPPLIERLRRACGDAVTGPPLAIFHGGAVKDGLLVEVALPVTRPVEMGPVYTRRLDGARAWTLLHRGPHDGLRAATGRLVEHARGRSGTLSGLREVYLALDPDHPEENLTQIQLVRHEWDRLLAGAVDSSLGEAACRQVMAGIDEITPESSQEQYTEWVRGAMDRLDGLTQDPVRRYEILSCCAHVFPEERIAHLRAIYHQRFDIDDVLREMYDDPAWYEDPVRSGNVLDVVKVPFDADAFAAADTPAARRQAYCHCAFVRPYLDDVPVPMSSTFCLCGAGWYRRLWEGILDRPVQVEHLGSLLDGHDRCRLAITLPLELEGEFGAR